MKTKIAIWGAGGHAKVVAEALRLNGCEIVGFLDSVNKDRKGQSFYGSTVLGGDEVLEDLLRQGICDTIVAFGDNKLRLQAAHQLVVMGFRLATAIHPNAVCAEDASIGEGSLVNAGAVIGPSSMVGRNVIVNTQATIDHDCVIGDGVHVCPGSILCGSVKVGEGAWIGAGATVIEQKQIGPYSVIGAGGVVVADIPKSALAIGVPARVSKRFTIPSA